MRNRTLGESSLFYQLELHQVPSLREDREPATQDHRVDQESVVVDDIEFDEALRERCAAVRDDKLSFFAL